MIFIFIWYNIKKSTYSAYYHITRTLSIILIRNGKARSLSSYFHSSLCPLLACCKWTERHSLSIRRCKRIFRWDNLCLIVSRSCHSSMICRDLISKPTCCSCIWLTSLFFPVFHGLWALFLPHLIVKAGLCGLCNQGNAFSFQFSRCIDSTSSRRTISSSLNYR